MEHHTMEHHTMDMSGMKMYFHYGYEEHFLFKELNVDTPIKMWLVCIVLFMLTILFEAIKYVRCVRCGCSSGNTNCAIDENGLQSNGTNVRLAQNCFVGRSRSTTKRNKLIQTLLHTTQTAIGFLLMLSIMSFNLCLIFPILVGSAAGFYYFYRSYNEVEAIDSCH